MLDLFRAEVRFYREVAPLVGVRVPVCYQAEGTGEGTVLVLEDLSACSQGLTLRQPPVCLPWRWPAPGGADSCGYPVQPVASDWVVRVDDHARHVIEHQAAGARLAVVGLEVRVGAVAAPHHEVTSIGNSARTDFASI